MLYIVEEIKPNAWYEDVDGRCHTVYSRTLATATTWRELIAKESALWYLGSGSDIFRNGVKIGNSRDLAEAMLQRQDVFTGKQYPVRLRDFLEFANGSET